MEENLIENHTPFPHNLRNLYRNLKSENSQDYAQKPQRNCTFMNSDSGLFVGSGTWPFLTKKFHSFLKVVDFSLKLWKYDTVHIVGTYRTVWFCIGKSIFYQSSFLVGWFLIVGSRIQHVYRIRNPFPALSTFGRITLLVVSAASFVFEIGNWIVVPFPVRKVYSDRCPDSSDLYY